MVATHVGGHESDEDDPYKCVSRLILFPSYGLLRTSLKRSYLPAGMCNPPNTIIYCTPAPASRYFADVDNEAVTTNPTNIWNPRKIEKLYATASLHSETDGAHFLSISYEGK